MSMMVMDLAATPTGWKKIPGVCAHCAKPVYESLDTLDDCYNVWAGTCPHCKAINLLSTTYGLRGYSSQRMELVLPFDEEVEANGLPKTIPTAGKGGPANMEGSVLNELTKSLRQKDT